MDDTLSLLKSIDDRLRRLESVIAPQPGLSIREEVEVKALAATVGPEYLKARAAEIRERRKRERKK